MCCCSIRPKCRRATTIKKHNRMNIIPFSLFVAEMFVSIRLFSIFVISTAVQQWAFWKFNASHPIRVNHVVGPLFFFIPLACFIECLILISSLWKRFSIIFFLLLNPVFETPTIEKKSFETNIDKSWINDYVLFVLMDFEIVDHFYWLK